MAKFLAFLGVLCWNCVALVAAPIQDHKIDQAALSELFSALGIKEGPGAIAQTQQEWLRKPGQERWEVKEISNEKRVFVLDWAKRQKMFEPWGLTANFYDKALILGATTSRMQTRLAHVANLWRKGVRFNELVWLTGERPLDKRIDGFTDLCQTESDAARHLWKIADMPPDMRAVLVKFIDVPMKSGKEGLKRPNTEDTIIAWLKSDPAPCRCFFVSDQPFCGYQFAVIKSVLPEAFSFDVTGKGADPDSHPAAAAVVLDSIARWLFTDRAL